MLYDLQRNIACCSDGTPLRERPHQNFGLNKIPSASGQHCVNLSPIKNYNFGWNPSFIKSPFSLVQMFYDLEREIASCSDGTPVRDASPEHWARYSRCSSFSLKPTLCRFEPHQKFIILDGAYSLQSHPFVLVQMFNDLQRKIRCSDRILAQRCLTKTLGSI